MRNPLHRALLVLAMVPGLTLAVPSPQDPEPTLDLILLGGGRSIRGELVKETEEEVFIDLGYTILAVPRKHVREVRRGEASEAPGATGGEERREREGDLFIQRRQPPLSVRENVDRVGEGVALIKVPGALGSGFVISAEGHVITNAHVVSGERNISVTLFRKGQGELEKKVFEKVRILAINDLWDLALLQIQEEDLEGEELSVCAFGDMDAVRVGEPVFAIGSPHGLDRTVSQGIVSSKNRNGSGMLFIQTTAAINPGNSGGPLFNLRGDVIGVNSMEYVQSEGLNFAIPITRVKLFLRNRDAFAYDKENPGSGVRYPPPPPKGEGGDED